MAETLRQLENVPVEYPPVPAGLSGPAAALDAEHVWARIENYTAHRYTFRGVKWIVEGPGEWCSPLTPVVEVLSTRLWDGQAWLDTTLKASPMGGFELGDGKYQIIADVGDGDPPAPLNEAYRRLAEYYAEPSDRAGASDYSCSIGGDLNEAYTRPPTWMARAMQLSGAADLLRPYRRA